MSLARELILPGGGNGGGAGSVNFSAGSTSSNLNSIVFSNANGVSFGLNGSTITGSITPAGGAQTAISGIIVSDATYTSGTVSLSNQNGVTIGSSTNGATQYIRLSVATNYQSQGAYLTTAMQSNAATISAINVSAGTTSNNLSALTFSNANGVSFGLNASTITGSVTPQSAQSAIKGLGVSNTGQTAGNTGLSTGIDWVLAGSQSITLSQSTAGGGPNTVWFQHPAWLTTAMQSNAATISAIKVSAGTTSNNLSAITFSNANGVSFGLNASTLTGSVAAQSAQSAIGALGVSNTGNTLGNTGLSTGIDWVIAGSGGITASESTAGGGPNTVWLSVANPVAQSNQTLGIYISDNSTGQSSSSTYDARSLTIDALGVASVGWSGGKLIVSVPSGGGAGDGVNIIAAGTQTANTTGTVVFSNSNNVSFGMSNSSVVTASASFAQSNQSAIKGLGVSNTGQTAGNTGISTGIDWVLAGSQSITLSQSTAAGGPNTIWWQHPAWLTTAMQSNAATLSNINISAGTTSNNLSALTFSNLNGVSFGLNASTVTASVAAQSNQSAIKGLGASNTGNTLGNTGLSTGIDWVLAGTGAVTVSESTTAGGPNTLWFSAPNAAAGNVTFSAGANSSGLGSVIFSNSNNVSFGLGAASVITASAAAPMSVGISTQGNTAGTTGFASASYQLVGTGALTLSQSTSNNGAYTLSLSVPASSQLTGVNGISLSSNGSTISIMPVFVSSYENMPEGFNATLTFNGASVSHAVAFMAPWPISASFLRIPALMTTNSTTISTIASATATASGALYSTLNAVVYSLGTGANSQSLLSVTSSSAGFTFQQSVSMSNSTQASHTLAFSAQALGAGTTLSTQYSISNTNYSFTTNAFTAFTSNRMLDIPFAVSLTPGAYWLVLGMSSSTASGGNTAFSAITNCNVRYSNHYALSMSNVSFGIMGSTNMTSGGLMGHGSFSTAGGGTTNSIPISAISSLASLARPYFQLIRSA